LLVGLAGEENEPELKVETVIDDLGSIREGSRTNSEAEVNRMMKLINSLYRNKEIFLREIISNASDALDEVRLLSLADKFILDSTEELSIKIKADKENHVSASPTPVSE